MTTPPVYSWPDAYHALIEMFSAARGWIYDNTNGQTTQRCPSTTNGDAIVVAAFLDDQLHKAPSAFGHAAMASRWEVCTTNLERSAVPPADSHARYVWNRNLWDSVREACLYLAQTDLPPPSRSTWQALGAQIAEPAIRNDWRTDVKVTESPDGRVSFDGWHTYDDLYLAQWSYYKDKRGSDPDPSGPIPRTTNADALQLADAWDQAVKKAESAGVPDKPGVKTWDSAKRDWDTAVSNAFTSTFGHDPHAVYAHNKELWDGMNEMSTQVTTGLVAPSRWDLFTGALTKSITHLPQNLAKGAEAILGGAASAIGTGANTVLGGLFGSFKWPLLIGGGAVGVYLLTRNRHDEPPIVVAR